MKLHRTTYYKFSDANGGRPVTKSCWHPSAVAASKNRTALKSADCRSDPKTSEVDVPTDKAGLIAWLNKNAG